LKALIESAASGGSANLPPQFITQAQRLATEQRLTPMDVPYSTVLLKIEQNKQLK